MLYSYLLVFCGGGLGSMLRFTIARWCAPLGWIFPVATLLSNLLSCLALGLILGLRSRSALDSDSHYFLAAGFCGGFSTFSTFSMENLALLQEGRWIHAAANIAGSISLGLAAFYLGLRLSS